MPYEWTETAYIIISITLRDDMAAIAEKIMPDVNEGEMFDGIRASITGNEPATHLMAKCPMKPEYAEKFRLILLADTAKPDNYPTKTVSKTDEAKGVLVNADPKSITVITDRIDKGKLKTTLSVKLAKSKDSALTTVSNIDDVLAHRELIRIPDTRPE